MANVGFGVSELFCRDSKANPWLLDFWYERNLEFPRERLYLVVINS